MSIKDLLPFVQNAIRKTQIFEFESQRVAIDVSCYLRRGFLSCAQDVAQGRRAEGYISYLKQYIDLLSENKNHIVLVFDGSMVHAKHDVNAGREFEKKERRHLAQLALANNKLKLANKHFMKCAEITPVVVNHVIEEFGGIPNVDILIAPYEADAQLAFLSINGIVDLVVTEDSDLIPFGCKKIAFKLTLKGRCNLYEKDNLYKCVATDLQERFDDAMFRRMCIFSGCDYVPTGIRGVDLKMAEEAFRCCKRPEIYNDIPAFVKNLHLYINIPAPKPNPHLMNGYLCADLTFAHQIVFNPRSRQQVPLTPFPATIILAHVPPIWALKHPGAPFSFLGDCAPDGVATLSAMGILEQPGMPRREVFSTNAASIYHPDFFKQELKILVGYPLIKQRANLHYSRDQGMSLHLIPRNNVNHIPLSGSPKSSSKEKRRCPFGTGSPHRSPAYIRITAVPRFSPVVIPPGGIGFVTPKAGKKAVDGENPLARPSKNRSFPTGMSPMPNNMQEQVFWTSSRSNSLSYVKSPPAFQQSYQ